MTAPSAASSRKAILREFSENRWMAHATLFRHRHLKESCDAHRDLVRQIYKPSSRVVIEGFRGFAKSTFLEETAVLRAGFREFHNMVVVGSSYKRACERLAAIKREFEVNPMIAAVFGPMRPTDTRGVWQEGKIVLTNGACIQALGRDQSMLGIKHLDWRPDAALVDDVEDPDEVRTDVERQATWDWFLKTFLPSLDHPLFTWVRVLGTRRGRGSLPERLEKDGWPVAKYPIEFKDDAGERQAQWPGKFPLPVIDQMRETYSADMTTWMQEYMCEPVGAEESRVFRREHIRVSPRVRVWEPVYAMYDPARTVNRNSATTGKAVWSWVKNRLIVWDAAAEMWLPDAMIDDIFKTDEEFSPIELGFEEDGLNEWARQPLRHEMLRRGRMLPLRPMRAPRDKMTFIRKLQLYFAAGEVEFAKPLPELEKQLLGFPYGRIDAPNALAYATELRPGAPIYDGFGVDHVAERLMFDRGRPLWLAANATRGLVVAAAVQYVSGLTRILADWAIEAEPQEAVPLIVREVGMQFRVAPTASCGLQHYDRYMNSGLVQAFGAIPLEVERGAEPRRGREVLRQEFGRLQRGMPAVQVAAGARLVVNALAGGYCRAVRRDGSLSEDAADGVYRLLMEGIEACLGRMSVASEMPEANMAVTPDGRRYLRYGNPNERRLH